MQTRHIKPSSSGSGTTTRDMAQSTRTSPYRPLSLGIPSQLRVIRLFPAPEDEVISCEFEHFSLDDMATVRYLVPSYTWGDKSKTLPINIDGRAFPVTENLHAFLKHMRKLLYRICRYLPKPMQGGEKVTAWLVQDILVAVMRDPDFPIDFEAASDHEIDTIVGKHTHVVLEGVAAQMESTWILDAMMMGIWNRLHGPWPTKCYIRFWIDAICIDQNSVEERNHQVKNIHEIYRRASAMVIWPLNSPPWPAGVSDLLRRLRPLHNDLVRARLRGTTNTNIGEGAILQAFTLSPADLVLVRDMLSNSWFSRIWVLQEVACTITRGRDPIMLYGFQPFSWRMMVNTIIPHLVRMFSESPGVKGLCGAGAFIDTRNIFGIRDIALDHQRLLPLPRARPPIVDPSKRELAATLSSLLRCTAGSFFASDPRDYLYALSGMLGTRMAPVGLRPNYGLHFDQVVHQYASFLIENAGDLSFLNFTKKGEGLEDTPTWLPDWRALDGQLAMLQQSKALRSINNPATSPDGRRLEVEGVLVGTVAAAPYLGDMRDELDGNKHCFIKPNKDPSRLDETEKAIQDTLPIVRGLLVAKEMCLDVLAPGMPKAFVADFEKQWVRLWPSYGEGDFVSVCRAVGGDKNIGMGDVADYVQAIRNRTTFLTLKDVMQRIHKMGIFVLDTSELVVPCRDDIRVEAGDIVCLLSGVGSPCILRRSGNSPGMRYEFVSACRLHSINVEEFLKGPQSIHRFVVS